MIKCGITGLMGSGKSYISSLFAERGVPVYNSDERARWVNNNVSELKSEIVSEFGDVYDSFGNLDRFKIRKIVFVSGGEEKLRRLNEICHPYVLRDFDRFCENNRKSKFVIAESAILFESGMDRRMDRIIFVDAPYSVRVSRAFVRDGIRPEEYDFRMRMQIDEQYKKSVSDFILFNGDSNSRKFEVEKIYNILVEGKKSSIFV
jgi:dephospho-CoA kinase